MKTMDLFTAVQALYGIEDCPLPLAVDLFEKTLVPSVEESSEDAYFALLENFSYDFMATRTEDDCPFTDWSLTQNRFGFTKGYLGLFENPGLGLWIAYEALSMVFRIYPDHHAADLQVFCWKGRKFYAKCQRSGKVIFFTPEEY